MFLSPVTSWSPSDCIPPFKKKLYYYYFVYTSLSLSGNSGRLTWVRLQQPQEQRYPVLQVHTGSFRVSVIHRTLTWTTGSITSVHDHSYACVYTLGLGTPTTSQQNIFDSEELSQMFLVLLARPGFEPRVFGSRVRRSTNWAIPSACHSVSHIRARALGKKQTNRFQKIDIKSAGHFKSNIVRLEVFYCNFFYPRRLSKHSLTTNHGSQSLWNPL